MPVVASLASTAGTQVKVCVNDDASTTCDESDAPTPASSVCSSAGSRVKNADQVTDATAVGRPIQVITRFEAELTTRAFALLQSFDHCPAALADKKLATDQTCRNGALMLVRRCFQLLGVVGYSRDSMEVMAAHGAVYMSSLNAALHIEGAPELPLKECSYVFCLMMFLAHSHVEDVTLPLRRWHKHLFVHYCSLNVLNTALLGLMNKLNYKLRVSPSKLEQLLVVLQYEHRITQ